MFFNADYRVFDFDEEAMKKQPGTFVLKESDETDKSGGGMGRSEVGVFGIVPGDFPPEVDEQDVAKEADKVDDEAVREKPSA
jgi:hypothetical protein